MKLALSLLITLSSIFCFASPKEPRTVELNVTNTVVFDEEVNYANMDLLLMAVIGKRNLLPPEKQLYIIIASPGGGYSAAVFFAAVIKKVPNAELICKYCASAAGYMFASAAPLKRLAISKSEVVMHEMFCEHVTANDIRMGNCLSSLEQSSDEFNKVMYTILGMSKEAYDEKIIDKVWTVKGEDTVKLHLADELVKLHCDKGVNMMAPDTCAQ